MTANKKKTKKPVWARLGWIGVWATAWWGVSCLYVLLLVLAARNDYSRYLALPGPGDSAASIIRWWSSAMHATYDNSTALQALLAIIVVVWIVGGWFWLRTLKQQNISYKAGFKDLFLTVRK